MNPPFALTIHQLYDHMLRAGYGSDDLVRVRRAYETALDLFAGRVQNSGKAFIEHGVGTASVLVSLRAPVDVVSGGLLHNVYWNGDFGDGVPGMTAAKRRELTRLVGSAVERYAAGFRELRWDGHVREIRDRIESMDAVRRNVVLIRLAELLEHLLDRGILYTRDGAHRLEKVRDELPVLREISVRLGHSTLADDLALRIRELEASPVPEALRTARAISYIAAPRSYRKTYGAIVRQRLYRGLGLRRALRKIRRRESEKEKEKEKTRRDKEIKKG